MGLVKKNESYNEVEKRCSMSKIKHGECKWDGLWSVKWMRWKWMTKWTFGTWNEWDGSD